MHSHDFYELYFFVNGNASYFIEDAHYRLQPGDMLLISPSDLHRLDINDTYKEYERIVLWLNPRYIKTLSTANTDLAECFDLSYRNKHYLIRDLLLSEIIREKLEALCADDLSGGYGADIAAEINIKGVLLALNKYTRNADYIAAPKDTLVSKALHYICANIASELSLDVIADAMFISKYYLSRLFKNETNSTIHQYIIKKRLVLSKQYIEQGLSISATCAKCGFADYTHFFRSFKKEYGITPKQYLALTR